MSTPTLEELRAAVYANGGPLQHPFHDPNFVYRHAGPFKVGKGYAVEFETRETGVRGVVRVQVIWSPDIPPPRVMERCMETTAYTRAFMTFCALMQEALDAADGK